jgi:RimJ/RimL family protein N-acetyltransferase
MEHAEAGMIIDYFHSATPEHLETVGLDPTRFPTPERWRRRYETESGLPYRERSTVLVLWELDGAAFGFSTADKIRFGVQANMHLHIVDPDRRRAGLGSECVRRTAAIYFDVLELERLLCEPNAFNIAPNRTLQRAGFTYVKTHMTVPGPLNYHQAVTRWVLESTARPPRA